MLTFAVMIGFSVCSGHIRDMEAANPPVALDQRQHGSLGRNLALAVCRLATNEGLVAFDNLICAAERIGRINSEFSHCLSDAVSEEPRGFQTTAEGSMKLTGGDALFRRAKQVDRLKPDMHRDMAGLKYRPHPHRERLAARAAVPQAGPRGFALHAGCLTDGSAMRANRTIGPQPRFDVLDRSFFVSKVRRVQERFHGGSLVSIAILHLARTMSSVTLPPPGNQSFAVQLVEILRLILRVKDPPFDVLHRAPFGYVALAMAVVSR